MEWVELQESEESDEDCEREARAGAAEGGGREEREREETPEGCGPSATSEPQNIDSGPPAAIQLDNMLQFPRDPEMWDLPHLLPLPDNEESNTGAMLSAWSVHAAAADAAALEEPTADDDPDEYT
eukprot:gnl/TRDRNA2_/TRDRNA2_177182_c1_seq20.p2 gnl/TRDRNA2_/TRDRNA2_177182_c1~~gnl/TRDRNA2_/TRDRNA2_177182_c1_seq20.p2  ORF type:complete len:132 (-),score=28.97 gnl/TRDRNA2_/TRDRNA2_177182_c1_seq20:174-548(-)